MNAVFALVIGSAQLLGYPSRTCTDAELLEVARQAQENAIRECETLHARACRSESVTSARIVDHTKEYGCRAEAAARAI